MNNGIFIEKIDITSFGKLKNKSISPSAGINILTLPNESGKSTLAAFIKYIFYGFEGVRKQVISENEKLLYTPWDNSRLGGGITLATPNGKFRIERFSNSGKESVDIYDVYSRKSVFSGSVPGEVFFGIKEENFGKIMFMRQLFQGKNGDSVLAEQVQNLMFSTDERVNTEKTAKKLKELRSTLKNTQKHGIIPDLESELSDYDEKFSSAVEIKNQLDNIQVALGDKKQKIAFNEAKLQLLESEMANERKYEAKKRLESFLSLANRKQEAEEKYRKCVEQFSAEGAPDTAFVQGLINDNAEYSLYEKKISSLQNEIKTETESLEEIKKQNPLIGADAEKLKSEIKKSRTASLILFALCGIFAVAAVVAAVISQSVLLYASAALAVISGISGILFANKKPSAIKSIKCGISISEALKALPETEASIKEKTEKIKALSLSLDEEKSRYSLLGDSIKSRIEKYMDNSDGEYNSLLQKMLGLSIEAGSLKAESISIAKELDAALRDVDVASLKELSEGAVEPSRDMTTVNREYNFYKQANDGLKSQEMELEKQKSYLEAKSPSPSVLSGKKAAVAKKLGEMNLRYNALSLALEVLEESNDYMNSTISPKIAEVASSYFAGTSGEKYKGITLSTDLSASVETEFGNKSMDFLSSGAKDNAYICLRFALIDLLYGKIKPFMVLDDAFSRIDDDRLKLIIGQIAALSQNQQIFIMTCHKRESDILGEMNAEYRALEL